jgi:hypothetical protein
MAVIEQGGLSLTSATVISVNLNPGSIVGSGKTTVTTAGTQVALSSSLSIISVTVRALSTNTGKIYVGTSSVSSTDGFQLSASETVSIDIDDLAKVYIDSSVNGEGVTYIYLV